MIDTIPMNELLEATFVRTRDEKPLVIVESSIGIGAEFTPAQLRALAAAIVRVADEADRRPTHGKAIARVSRSYATPAHGQSV